MRLSIQYFSVSLTSNGENDDQFYQELKSLFQKMLDRYNKINGVK